MRRSSAGTAHRPPALEDGYYDDNVRRLRLGSSKFSYRIGDGGNLAYRLAPRPVVSSIRPNIWFPDRATIMRVRRLALPYAVLALCISSALSNS